MDFVSMVVWGVAFPSLFSAAVATAGWMLFWKSRPPLFGGAWAAPVGIGTAYLIAAYMFARPPLPPIMAQDWVLVAAILVIGRGLKEHFFCSTPGAIPAARVLTAGIAVLLVGRFADGNRALMIAIPSAIIALDSVLLERLAARRSNIFAALLSTAVASGVAVVLIVSGSAKLAQMAGIVAAAVGPWIVAALFRRDAALGSGVFAWMLLSYTLLLCGHWYADVPVASLVLMAAAPALPWLFELKPLRIQNPFVHGAFALALASLAIAAAVYFGIQAAPAPYEY